MKLEKKIKGEQSLVAMLGINDENLRFLKKQFPKTKINVRGDAFYLDGDEQTLNKISSLIDKLLLMATNNKIISPSCR